MTLALDTETHLIAPGVLAPRLVCLSIAWDDEVPPAWLPPAGPDVLVEVAPTGAGGLLPYAGRALLGRDAALAPGVLEGALGDRAGVVGANLPYDLAVLLRARPDVAPVVWDALDAGRYSDVQVRERLLANARGTLAMTRVALAALAARYLGVDRASTKGPATDGGPDPWRLRYAELDGVLLEDWPDAAVVYALDDASDTLAVHRAQGAGDLLHDGYPIRVVDEGAPGGVRVVSEDRELRAAWALHLMALYGLRTDPAAVEELLAEWTTTATAGRVAGLAGGWVRGLDVKPASKAGTLDKAALQSVVRGVLGDDTPRTPTCGSPVDGPLGSCCTRPAKHDGSCSPRGRAGAVRIDKDTLTLAAGRPGAPPTLRAYADSLQAARWASVWGDALRAGTTRPITSRPLHLVATGRTSWSEPPLQQLPRKGGVRECFVPRPGFVFCSVDYHVAELCALAQVHRWMGLGSTMADAINAGRDLHLVTAAAIATAEGTPMTYTDAVTAYRVGDPAMRHRRQLAKVANFGFPGGLGAARLVEYAAGVGVVVGADEAVALRTAWLSAWPEMRGYFAAINRLLGEGGSCTVQHPISGRLRGGVGYTDGCNGFFQGLVADGAKAAAHVLARAAYTGRGHPRAMDVRGIRPVLFLHDEIIAELPIDRAHVAAEAMTAIMVDAMQVHIPDVRITAEPALMSRWHKAAETVRDTSGRLVTAGSA